MAAGGYAQYLVETSVNSENTSTALSTVPWYFPATSVAWQKPSVLDDRSDELRGTFETLPVDVVAFDASTFTLNERLYPNNVGIPFMLALGTPVYTAGGTAVTDPDGSAVPAGTNKWVWDSALVPAQPKSAQITIAYPDAVDASGASAAAYFKGVGVSSTGFSITHNGQGAAQIQSDQLATYVSRIANPSLTASFDAVSIRPFVKGHHSIPTWLSNTNLPIDINYQMAAPIESYYAFANASKSPTAYDKTTPPVLTANLTLRSVDPDDFDAFAAGTQFTVKTRWVHDQFITGSAPYKLFIEGNAQYTTTQVEDLKHQIRHQQTMTVQFGKGVASSAWKITLINGTTSYSNV